MRRPAVQALAQLLVLLSVTAGCDFQTPSGEGNDRSEPAEPHSRDKSSTVRISFGSCADDDAPEHPVWRSLVHSDPDVFVMMGDNVYADTPEFRAAPTAALMKQEYAKLSATPGFATLRATRPVFATWDDHDFGQNDGGASFSFKTTAAKVFKEFWGFAPNDPALMREGVYSERRIKKNGIDVQVLLLDTRTFRGRLNDASRSLSCPLKNYELNTSGPFLGEAQWEWLAQRLKEKADLRLLVSGQQVIPDQHCFEKWGNFPHERLRLFETLRLSGATNALLLSGDRHLGEISKLPASAENGAGFDLFEVTASPLSARSGFGWGEANDYRVSADSLRESQFGVLDISRANRSSGADIIRVSMQLHDQSGDAQFVHVAEFAASEGS